MDITSAALRAFFLTMLHKKEIGVYNKKALKVLIVGVANEIFGEGN